MSVPQQPLKLNAITELHTLLFEVMDDGVLIVDGTGCIQDCNPAFYRRLGYEKDELIGMNVAQLDPPEFAPKVPERIATIARDGHAVFETAHYRKDGSIMPVELSARMVEVAGKKVFFSIVRDISERIQTSKELKASERMYRAVVETAEDGFWATDMQGRLLEVNDAYIQKSGYSRKELLRMGIPDLEARETPEETAEHIENLFVYGHDRFETIHRTKEGKLWPVEIVTSYWPIDGGRLFVFSTDITERKRHEAELNKLSQALEQAGEGILISDTNAVIEYVNPALEKITGYTSEELIGKKTSVFKSHAQDPMTYKELWQTISRGEVWQGSLIDRRKDGSFYPALVTIAPVHDDHGKATHYVSSQQDMSEYTRMENQLLQAQKMESMGTLVGGIAHDFNQYGRISQQISPAQYIIS